MLYNRISRVAKILKQNVTYMPKGQHQCERTSAESDLWTQGFSWSPVCTSQQTPQEMFWRILAVYPSDKNRACFSH